MKEGKNTDSPINQNIYFAYGSNLNLRQMAQRCPTAKLLGTGAIPDHELLFRGREEGQSYLTVRPCPGAQVPVAAFSVQPSDVHELDLYEDVPGGLYRVEPIATEIRHEGLNRGVLEGFWYVMNDARRLPPSQEYWETLVEGYRDVGFDATLLEKALEK